MSLIKAIKRLEYANFLIKKKATGDLETFAKKMKISKRTVAELLIEMRYLGASIQYDRINRTYFFTENGEFSISKFMKYGEVLSKNEAANIGRPDQLCFSEKAVFELCKEF